MDIRSVVLGMVLFVPCSVLGTVDLFRAMGGEI